MPIKPGLSGAVDLSGPRYQVNPIASGWGGGIDVQIDEMPLGVIYEVLSGRLSAGWRIASLSMTPHGEAVIVWERGR